MSVKKLVVVLLGVLLAVAAVDVGLDGLITRYVQTHAFPGDYAKIHYVMRECDKSFLLLGASQCSASYETELFEKELGTDAFNCGLNAQTVELFDVILDGCVRRKPPKHVLLALRPLDLISRSTERLSMLNIYYGTYTPLLDRYLENGSLFNRLTLKSSLLRINTHWWRILLYHFMTYDELKNGGFVAKPVRDLHPTEKIHCTRQRVLDAQAIIPEKKAVLDHLVETCRRHGIRLHVVLPPTMTEFSEFGNPYAKLLEAYCAEKGVDFFNDAELPEIADRPEYFFDDAHLNADGARAYTKLFLEKYGKFLKTP